MHQHVSFITLATADLDRAARFYVNGLGWTPAFRGDDVLMFRVGPALMLSLWTEAGFESEVGPLRRGEDAAPLTLAHNFGSPDAVDAVLADAERAGARVTAGEHRVWGGYSGYFSDPDDFRWEVAWNPDPDMAFVNAPAE